MRPALILFIAALLLPWAAFAQDQAPAPAASAPPATPSAQADQTQPVALANPPMTGPQLLIQTSMGDITLQLDQVRAPASVASILRYTRERHYDGTIIYRVVKGFVVQMGSWEAGGKGRGVVLKPVPLEANNGLKNYRGAVALPRGDEPTSAGPDFFIDLSDNTTLDQKLDDTANRTGYAVFGQVASGMDVVNRIAQVAVGGGKGPMPDAEPVDPIIISRISVIGDPPPKPVTAAKPTPATPAPKKPRQ
jgi:peptidyl-prolyl cis-trans isomerase A (cyclophilin A)